MKQIRFAEDPVKFIKKAIIKFTKENPGNKQKSGRGKYWGTPLVGFASSNDPLFKEYKKIIGKFHFTPEEFFGEAFGKQRTRKPLSVISWILPASEGCPQEQQERSEIPLPSLGPGPRFRRGIQPQAQKAYRLPPGEKGLPGRRPHGFPSF